MSERKTETIEIGKGVQYAKVASRSAEFHRDNETCSVETSCEFKEGYVLFSATVTTKKGVFTGHSLAKIGNQQKQFEKQETIAVGRALAFAGYLSSGDIACQEEMADLVTTSQLNSLKLKFAKTRADELTGLDRVAKAAAFTAWAKEITGEEDFDPLEASQWDPAWHDQCWKYLVGAAADVPFEG